MMPRIRASLQSLGEVVSLIWHEASRFVKIRMAIVLGLLVATAAITPLGPLALKLLVDRFTGSATWSMRSIGFLIGLYVLSQWLARCMGEIRGIVYARAERRMFRTVSERLFSHIMHLPMRFHLDRQTGAIGQIIDNGLQGYQLVLHGTVFTFLPVLMQLGTVSIILLHFNQPAFLAIFGAATLCYATAFSYSTAYLGRAAESASTTHVDAAAVMTDSILNYETVKFFAAESTVLEKVGRAFSNTENMWVGFFRRSAYSGIIVATIFSVFLAISILYAAHQVKVGGMTVGDFVLVNTYMLQMMAPLEMIGYAVQGLSQGLGMLQKMMALLREAPEPMQMDDQIPLAATGQLEFEHVCLSYRADRAVLRDVSFRLLAGKTLGIVGASGAGKSTLIRLLVRLFEVDGGRILLDDAPISELPLKKLRRAIAVVPQDTVLFNDTIRYNIGFGRTGSTLEEIMQAAKVAHLHDFIMSLPEKYDTQVGERGVKLSGGEKQRVSIARAAIKHPRIYVFDEATSSLDTKTEREILVNLREMSRSSTTLIIAHRLSTVVHADEIVVLDGGAIVERGNHAQLIRMNGRYADLWRTQQQPETASAQGATLV